MPMYLSRGDIPRKRHTVHRRSDGALCHEQLIGHEGFSGLSSLLYHIHPPTAIESVETIKDMRLVALEERVLKHRHFRTSLAPRGGSATMDRIPLLFNQDIAMYWVVPGAPDDFFYRNAQADEVVYVSRGDGTLRSQFGDLPFRSGDYVVVPRGIVHRFDFEEDSPPELLIMESRGHIRAPRRYRNHFGQLIEGAPYSERDFRLPEATDPVDEKGSFPIRVKQYDAMTEMHLQHHPFDVVGWDGYFYPWVFNIHDFEPIVGRIHQPPPVHQTFEGDGFVICSFCPRPYDFDEAAIPAPYNHSNVDSDEVLFYASEDFMSRDGIEFGSITHHPDGLPHGPHPGKYEASIGKKRTDELAVMMDSFRPLHVAAAVSSFEDPEYATSWAR